MQTTTDPEPSREVTAPGPAHLMSEEEKEFRAILALQQEIDAKLDELMTRIKAVMTRIEGRILVELDGEIYELKRVDYQSQALDVARKHGGFFSEFRLVRLGKPRK